MSNYQNLTCVIQTMYILKGIFPGTKKKRSW